MRMLFEMDKKDYSGCTHTFTRNSARSIIIRNGKVAMVHSLKYDYYKFPGGGIEEGEDPIDTMVRETREEAGLNVIRETVKEYGIVHRIQKSDKDATECFEQDNYYYLCEAEEEPVSQDLDDYEAKESYRLEYVEPAIAIKKNRNVQNSPYNKMMFEREARVLELLQREGYLKTMKYREELKHMANILILNGSPRKNGATASLIKAFTEGAKEVGNEIREAFIQGMDVKNCLGCDACMKTHTGCVQKDAGMAQIYEDLTWCDVIVFASPVYFGYLTAQLKTVIDRMWAWFNLPGNFSAKKKAILLSTARGTDYSATLDQYGIYSKYMGWEDLGHILGIGKETEARALGASIQ